MADSTVAKWLIYFTLIFVVMNSLIVLATSGVSDITIWEWDIDCGTSGCSFTTPLSNYLSLLADDPVSLQIITFIFAIQTAIIITLGALLLFELAKAVLT